MAILTFILKNKTLILIAVIVLLLVAMSGMAYYLKIEIANGKRHKQNYNIATSEIKHFKTLSGSDAVTIQELQLTKQELKKTADSTIKALLIANKELGNKAKHIEQLLAIKTKTVIKEVEIPIYDTLIVYKKDTISRISSIQSKWLDVSIGITDDRLIIFNYESRDDIIIVLKWYKQGTWFIPRWFEKRKYAADITSANPNSKITQARNVRITGRKGR